MVEARQTLVPFSVSGLGSVAGSRALPDAMMGCRWGEVHGALPVVGAMRR